jgi:hypothetical protein
MNYALKLYLLWRDTDLDFIYFNGSDQPESYGFDFSRNLSENIEIHSELGVKQHVRHTMLDDHGNVSILKEDQLSYLFGLRYLNAFETTFIAEYYHNGAGYSRSELDDFFVFQESAYTKWLADGDAVVVEHAERVARSIYRQPNFAQNYFYFKITQKDLFDILYFTPWFTIITNLQDYSFNLQPGMTWTPLTNLEINFRAAVPVGPSHTEYGEKTDAFRTEVWIRFHF